MLSCLLPCHGVSKQALSSFRICELTTKSTFELLKVFFHALTVFICCVSHVRVTWDPVRPTCIWVTATSRNRLPASEFNWARCDSCDDWIARPSAFVQPAISLVYTLMRLPGKLHPKMPSPFSSISVPRFQFHLTSTITSAPFPKLTLQNDATINSNLL